MNHVLRTLGLAATIGLAPRAAEACGGFFCNAQQPVVQTGERIIFTVDEQTNTVEALIQISFQGNAADFAWVLPLQSAPSLIEAGSNRAFQVVEARTRPTFNTRYDTDPDCWQGQFPGSGGGANYADAGVAAGDAGAPGVSVLSAGQVGPYDSVVLSGSEPAAVRTWLEEAGYRVTDAMMDAVTPYLAKGDVLLALKLQKDASLGELQPIALTMAGTEVCIPIRLTAIAAQDDMDVTAFVLSNRGRAVPSNYLHVTPNLAAIDWQRGGANYRQVMGAAVDEAGGNAFTTEYAGPASSLYGAIYLEASYDLSWVREATNLADLMSALAGQGLFSRPEMRAILARHVTNALLTEHGVEPSLFWQCPNCVLEQLRQIPFAPGMLADEVQARILDPDRRAQGMFDRHRTLTRLFTLLSPEEMTVDPVFGFDPAAAEVSNQHNATIYTSCNSRGEVTQTVLELEDGLRISLDRTSNLPAAERVEDLANGRVVTDNRARIGQMAGAEILRDRSCGCASTSVRGSPLLALLLLGLLRRRRL